MLVRLVVPAGGLSAGGLAAISSEFPTVEVRAGAPSAEDVSVDAARWTDPRFGFAELDRRAAEAASCGAFGLAIDDAGHALPLLTRCQRFVGRRNRASAGPDFDGVLAAHRALHDLDRPLCRADYDHALDTWQWLLRLSPGASLEVQAAALFHDVERLESEALVRVEQHAASYQDFKDAHARRGAAIAGEALSRVGLRTSAIERIGALVAGHERHGADPEGIALAEADALSFFSLNSDGFLDYYGGEHTRRKVGYTLRRLRAETRRRLSTIRLRPELEAFVDDLGG